MVLKRLATTAAAVSLATAPVSPALADAGDAIAGGIIGGIISGVIVNEANKNQRTKKVYRKTPRKSYSGISSAQRAANREVQVALNYFGYPVGAPDGVVGRKTRGAISDYQMTLGYPATGAAHRIRAQPPADLLSPRAVAGGPMTMNLAAQNPMGMRGLLVTWRDEAMGITPQGQMAVVPAAPAATTGAGRAGRRGRRARTRTCRPRSADLPRYRHDRGVARLALQPHRAHDVGRLHHGRHDDRPDGGAGRAVLPRPQLRDRRWRGNGGACARRDEGRDRGPVCGLRPGDEAADLLPVAGTCRQGHRFGSRFRALDRHGAGAARRDRQDLPVGGLYTRRHGYRRRLGPDSRGIGRIRLRRTPWPPSQPRLRRRQAGRSRLRLVRHGDSPPRMPAPSPSRRASRNACNSCARPPTRSPAATTRAALPETAPAVLPTFSVPEVEEKSAAAPEAVTAGGSTVAFTSDQVDALPAIARLPFLLFKE